MSGLRIQTLVLGRIGTNCYLVYHEDKKEAVIIDPADNGAFILNKCKEIGLTPVAVLLTHGHFDHIMAAEDLVRAFRIPLYAGNMEQELLKDPSLNMSADMGGHQISLVSDILVRDKQILDLIGFQWKVIETPGHTSGSVCYQVESQSVIFSGDTLFAESLGRTDFPTGSSSAIVKSITEKLFSLAEDTKVYPGHGEPTTIRHEKKYNPAARCR